MSAPVIKEIEQLQANNKALLAQLDAMKAMFNEISIQSNDKCLQLRTNLNILNMNNNELNQKVAGLEKDIVSYKAQIELLNNKQPEVENAPDKVCQ